MNTPGWRLMIWGTITLSTIAFVGYVLLMFVWVVTTPPEYKLIQKGMTKEEVRAKYGPPKKEYDSSDGSSWYYGGGPLHQVAAYSVSFDKDGQVDHIFCED